MYDFVCFIGYIFTVICIGIIIIPIISLLLATFLVDLLEYSLERFDNLDQNMIKQRSRFWYCTGAFFLKIVSYVLLNNKKISFLLFTRLSKTFR